MIASVRGQVTAVGPDGAVLEVGGVGLSVQCTPGTLARLSVGEPTRLATSLVVREDSLTLYGFADDDERLLFELLQSASGVGPRLAQAVLAVHPPREVRRALATADIAALTRVPGIGRKGAERMVLELRDRIGELAGGNGAGATVTDAAEAAVAAVAPWRDQLRPALTGLGWSAREADQALDALTSQAEEGADLPTLLRQAVRMLGRSAR